jgi:phosphoribosylamine--glycine ligase
MMTDDGPKVLEYNVRFGDPETQVLLPLLKTDLLSVLYEAADGALPKGVELYNDRAAATVVVASKGYPGAYEKGKAISPLQDVEDDTRVVFHAGTSRGERGLETSGGRVLAVTAWAPRLADAVHHAYEGVSKVAFEGAFYRSDIGRKAL